MLHDYTEQIDCKFDDSYPNMSIEKLESTLYIYMCVCVCACV